MRIIDQYADIVSPASKADAVYGLKLVEQAGRNCYASQNKITEDSYKGFIRNLLKREHYSPLEFFDATVRIVTSRDVMAELTRHRLSSFCIESQRYIDVSKDGISFIKPIFAEKDGSAYGCWINAMEAAEQQYNTLKEHGLTNQDARKVLPNSTACVIYMKANLREWLHIFKLRNSNAAYPEMHQLAAMIQAAFEEYFPELFEKVET